MKKDEFERLEGLRKTAVKLMLDYGKSYCSAMSDEGITAVEKCMEEAHCNNHRFRTEFRRMEAMQILFRCLPYIDDCEQNRIETALMSIARR